jgi:putative ABC transport system permease protein
MPSLEASLQRPGLLVRQTARDVAFGFRLFRRAPGFAVASVLIIGLGVGATTAIFSVVYGVMLRPLPYPEPDRLVALWSRTPATTGRVKVNPADQRDLLRSTGVFEDVALANAPQNFNLIGDGEPERVVAARLASNMFSVLGISPRLGRRFTANDEQAGNGRVVLLSDGLWRRRFAGDPSIVGRTINLSGTPYEVIGVMDPQFHFPEREHQLWIPLGIDPRLLARQITGYNHFAIARLKAGIGLTEAQRDVEAFAARLEADYPNTNRGVRLEVLPMAEESIRAVRPALYSLLAAVASLMLIACFNLASLVATRAAGRTHEFAVRLALGASHSRLTVLAVAELVPVLLLGGIFGVVAAKLAAAMFIPLAPAALPRVDAIEINGAVLLFSLAVVMLTGVVAGILPAVRACRGAVPADALGARSTTGSRHHVRMRRVLVVAQIALTLPLLHGATVLGRSFAAIMAVNPGFRTDNVLALHMAIPRSKYPTDQAIAAFYTRIIDRVRGLPGVVSAAMVNRVPLSGNDLVMALAFEGVEGGPRLVQSRSATPDYFTTLGIPLREGRAFTERDSATAPLVGIIDERLAASLWRNESAIGKRFQVALPGQPPASGQVVGVVGNIRHQRLDNDDDRQVYFNYQQFTDGRIALVVRSQSDVRAIVPAVVQSIHTLDPEQPVYDVGTMDHVLARSAAERWLNTAIIGTFATCALLLAGVGLYGVIAYGVTQRVREFGLRIALGAAPSRISRLVLVEGLVLAGTGAAIGLGGAVALSRGMRNLLYGVTALDPLSVASATAVLLVVAIVASYLPARRAALSAPADTLRGA